MQSQNPNFIIEKLINWHQKLVTKRATLENNWAEIIIYVRPQKSVFAKNYKNIYDSTAIFASEYLTSALFGMTANNASNWFELKSKSSFISVELSKWFSEVNYLMRENLADSNTSFYYKSYEFYADLVSYGTALFYISENLTKKNLVYTSQNLNNCYIDQTEEHNIDTVFRSLTIKAKEVESIWGYNNLSTLMNGSLKREQDQEFEVLNITLPSKYFGTKKALLKNMPFASYYIDISAKHIISLSGYYEFPYICTRWSTNSQELYGESPAMSALPDIKMLNIMSKTMLIAAQKEVDPPILAPHEAAVQGLRTMPGGIIYGGIDPITGNQLFKPLATSFNLQGALELQEQRRIAVKEAFLFSLLTVFDTRSATATEVISNNEQKVRLLGSKISRIQSEFLAPVLKRQYLLMRRLNLLPNPQQHINLTDIEIEFTSPWNKNQKYLDNTALEDLTALIANLQTIERGTPTGRLNDVGIIVCKILLKG